MHTEVGAMFAEQHRILNRKRANEAGNHPSSSYIPQRQLQLNNVTDTILCLRAQRLQDYCQPVYIAPLSKACFKTGNSTLRPLMDRVLSFLGSSQDVMVILGDSGSGKSTFSLHLEQQLWHNFDNSNIIPLHIHLASIHEPEHDMINKQLRIHGFTKSEIQELKKHYGFILICDGYDERQQLCNLYTANLLNRPHQWRAKMVISCRTQFLGPNYQHLFAPLPSNHYKTAPADIFQQAVIVPFSKEQVKDYVVQYTPFLSRPWTVEDYLQVLGSIPDLMDLVTNPFLLTLALEALPGVIEGCQDLSAIRLTPVQLYDHFVNQWFVVNLQRLQASVLSSVDRETLNWLLDADFISKGIDYSTGLATAMFDMQDGIPVVKYVHINDKDSWRGRFFGPQPIARLLRESSPLTRAGTSYRFLHRSLQEYFFSLAIFDPRYRGSQDEFDPFSQCNASTAQLLDPNNPLFKHNLAIEPSIIDFLCERVKQSPDFQEQLLFVIHQSKTNTSTTRGASNAMTILVKAGVHFNSADLQITRIPHIGYHCQFDSALLQGASTRWNNVARYGPQRRDVTTGSSDNILLGELSTQDEEYYNVCPCVFSPDGSCLAVALCTGGDIGLYETTTYRAILRLEGHKLCVWAIAFSPDSTRLVSGGRDRTICLWNRNNGKMLLRLLGHTGGILCVEISPCGKRLFSSSHDRTVRIWCLQTGRSLLVLRGHTCPVTSVKYSLARGYLVTSGNDGSIGLWDSETGKSLSRWSSLRGDVRCIAYSPDGNRIVSGTETGVLRLWDAQTGSAGPILRGHTDAITCIAFSPCGEMVTSLSADRTVRLWDAPSEKDTRKVSAHCVFVADGFSKRATDISWNPTSPLRFATAFMDGSVRLWRVSISTKAKVKFTWVWIHNQGTSSPQYTIIDDSNGLAGANQRLLIERGIRSMIFHRLKEEKCTLRNLIMARKIGT